MIKKRFGTNLNNNPGTFSERVVAIARSIPHGQVTTYGRIARAAGGGTMSSQSITSILGKAYDRGVTDIPFHRIVYADGRIWIDDTHYASRMKLYAQEDIAIDQKNRVVGVMEKMYLRDF
jgi:alkylated DNA nucleotide flippase Atl1